MNLRPEQHRQVRVDPPLLVNFRTTDRGELSKCDYAQTPHTQIGAERWRKLAITPGFANHRRKTRLTTSLDRAPAYRRLTAGTMGNQNLQNAFLNNVYDVNVTMYK